MGASQPLTASELAFWRRLYRQSEKERRLNDRILAGLLRSASRKAKKGRS
jgi:hypothetical protein